jgi:hypothetical protein
LSLLIQSPKVDFRHGDARWLAYRKRALSDLYWFSSVVLGYEQIFPIREETHQLFCSFLERRTGVPDIDTAPIQKVEMPRGIGKTTCGTVAHSIQLACANPNISLLIANERQETADGFLASIKSQFETNDLLRALFPEVIPGDFKDTAWAASKATLKRTSHRPEPTFITIGVGGTVTGIHPDGIIVDDPISKEAMENARVGAWQIMERVNRWCNALKLLLNTQARPFPWIRFNGTRWWHGDTYEYIEDTFGGAPEHRRTYRIKTKLSTGETVSREVYRVGQMAVYRAAAIEDSVAVFPEIHSLEKLAEMRKEDPELFACNMMNEPANADVRTFQDGWLRYYDRVDPRTFCYRKDDGNMRYVRDDELRKVMVVDPAFTSTGPGARAAIVVTGTDMETGRTLILEADAMRREPHDLVVDVLNCAKRHRMGMLYIETVAQQIAFVQFVEREARARNLAILIEQVKPDGRNKDVRIEALSVYFRSHQILFHQSQLDILREYGSFRPGARYKDLLDALAYAAERWTGLGPGGRTATQRAQEQLDTYRARRGLTV